MLTLNDGRSELWQWDTGRKLTVDDDCSQVHFSNKVFGRSIDVDVLDGVAIIPDVLLQTDKELIAWAFVGTSENGYTKISKVFKVNRRNKPSDYVFTPPEQTTLGEILERLDDLESIQDPDAIKNAVDDYLANNPIMVKETDPTVPEWAKQPTPPDVKIPDKLPNPHSITFTGAVDASYDGSNPVEIKIPDSGGNIDEAVAKYLDENPIEGGMTNTEKNLILTLFRNAAYTSNDMGAVLAQLESMWSGGNVEPDNPDNPDVPVDPDEPEKTLTSISAVYSGGDVTADTAVNDLTGIVVTAHYSDGTSEAVTGYTLSGTIVEGSNTITVSYGGKTTTFAVTGVVEAVKLRGFQLTAPSNTTEWEYPGYNSALAKAMGNANWATNVYKKKLIPAGVYYVRFIKAGASVGVNYRMHTTTDVDFFTNLTANSATELTAESVVNTFTVDGTTSFVFANSDGSYEMRTDGYQYSTAVDNGYIVLAKFVIPEGQYGILHMANTGTNTNSTRYHEGYATVFYDDPTENITITEVVE